MYLSQQLIETAIAQIESVHPFFGITFLVAKKNGLLIEDLQEFPFNDYEQTFLETYFKPDKSSDFFFRPFKAQHITSKSWVTSKYVTNALHPARTSRRFKNAFLHPTGTNLWAWHIDYVETLKSNLYQNQRIPIYHLAIWLYRNQDWSQNTTPSDIIKHFLAEFNVTEKEQTELFDIDTPYSTPLELLQPTIASWDQIAINLGVPPPTDIQDDGGTLASLELYGIGPAKSLQIDFSERTNLFTGDNGLGKSFILETAWWALSNNWASFPAYPREDAKRDEPKIKYQISGKSGRLDTGESYYNWDSQEWSSSKKRPAIPGLLIFARADGAFAIWDPSKDYWAISTESQRAANSKSLILTREQVWNGVRNDIEGKTSFLFNGLILDWINWQNSPDDQPFNTLKQVLKRLSPPDLKDGDLGILEPGKPTRIPRDSRLIPTIKHSYGETPLLYASAGVRRIVALAYLIVWAWEEHKTQSELIRRKPEKRMVILVDELEAHLHPQWQRLILPALLDVRNDLDVELKVQLLVATHSPLVMASIEPRFDTIKDKIFHLNLVRHNLFTGKVQVEEIEFERYGTVDSWLRSSIFELAQARSVEAEQAIEDAKKLQEQEAPSQEDVAEISERLIKYLGTHDTFWPRWLYFAEQHGVKL